MWQLKNNDFCSRWKHPISLTIMLRKLRLTLALVVFVLITGLFLDFTGTLHAWLGWLAKIQFLPALLALNLAVVFFSSSLRCYSGESIALSSARLEFSRTSSHG